DQSLVGDARRSLDRTRRRRRRSGAVVEKGVPGAALVGGASIDAAAAVRRSRRRDHGAHRAMLASARWVVFATRAARTRRDALLPCERGDRGVEGEGRRRRATAARRRTRR